MAFKLRLASMGPRLFRRGNIDLRPLLEADKPELQWGHVFSDVEIEPCSSCTRTRPCFNGATSFQTWKSVGGGVSFTRSKWKLQWGHVFSDVEMIQRSRQRRRQNQGFNGATSFQTWKCRNKCRRGLGFRVASMGPRLFRRGNSDDDGVPLPIFFASMGPRLFRRGNEPCSSL